MLRNINIQNSGNGGNVKKVGQHKSQVMIPS